MLNLLPAELHYYSLGDLARGFVAATDPAFNRRPITLPSLGDGIPLRSARAGIVLAIKALNLEPGSRIGVPLHCCPVVFKAIKTAGCRPRFLDVDPGTFCISPEDLYAKRSELDAVVAVHMFGNLCEMGSVQKAMDGKPIIEDCAQALGSTLSGQWAGSMGTIGVFSFRLGKYLSVGEGAAIYTSHSELRESLTRLATDLATPTMSEEIQHLLETFTRSKLRSKPFWGLLGSSIWGLYNKNTDFIDKSPIVMGQIFRSDLEIARHRMAHLDQMINSQRKNAAYYISNLSLDASMLCLERPGTFYNRLMFPVVFSSTKHRDFMRTCLKKSGISTATPYEEVIEGAAKDYGYSGDCPVAERLLKRTLVIPCNHRLRMQDIKHIVQSFNNAWANVSQRE
ncbi:MAG: DegT/DnrJ/EryC1/StrS family aminotransferase [Planctomycetes bacterium]|nr:DegT/DnrJ/EryC1/StrS family aminotransferase [Planctomycetota bacterium]